MSKRKRNRRNRILAKLLITFATSLMIVLLGGVAWFFVLCSIGGSDKTSPVLSPEQQNKNAGSAVAYDSKEMLKDFTTSTDHKDDAQVKEDAEQNLDDLAADNENVNEQITDVSMVFTGDVCFYDGYANMAAYRNRGSSIDNCISADLLSEMRNADICMINNEFAYSDRGAPLAGKEFTLCSKPENVKILSDMGVDIVSLANNHVYDYGKDAFLDTLQTLKNANVPYVGAGENLKEASAPYVFELNGRKIAYLSATQVERNANPETKGATDESPGTLRCYTDEEFSHLEKAIEDIDKEVDLTIVYIHWGSENTDKLHWEQEKQAPLMVKAGADLIIGDHPHCLQNLDFIEGVPVIYSLGNYWFNSKVRDTGLFKAVLKEDGTLQCQFLAAKQHDCRTDMETGEEKKRILNYMQCISPNVTIDEDGFIYNKPYDGPAINYAAVQRVPEPPATNINVTDSVTGEVRLVNKNTGEIIDPGTGNGTGAYVDLTTGSPR